MTKFLSEKIRKIPPTEVSVDRYEFIQLSETEPDLGVPDDNSYILRSNADGFRFWSEPIGVEVISNFSLSGLGTNSSPLQVESLTTPVTISLSGDVSGSVEFDGSSNVDIEVTSLTQDTFVTFTKSIAISTEWQDAGISGTDLDTGSYYIQVYSNNQGVGGKSIKEYHTGMMSWTSESISGPFDLPNDEITLHRAGASKEGIIYLRTFRSDSDGVLKLQIQANYATANPTNYLFKFRKII